MRGRNVLLRRTKSKQATFRSLIKVEAQKKADEDRLRVRRRLTYESWVDGLVVGSGMPRSKDVHEWFMNCL